MDSKNELKVFLPFIAFILGITLIKHIDIKNLTLEDPFMDILYIVVFILTVYFMIQNRVKISKHKN